MSKIPETKMSIAICALAGLLASGSALADTSGKKIAFSNNYAGNSWRQAMLTSYDAVAKKAVADRWSRPLMSLRLPTRPYPPRQRRSRI
jgi:ABC-type sugar transport system substrate-binding protein